ncbi:MAG: hypothetical protein NTZ90_02245 [Proteobacteria bacterium]|jgi:hypothetical protein|nr:hypothetical protein [Pseudomonadota bacterium]
MSETIDDLTISFYQDDRNVLKELQKVILTRGNWTTIMYLFQELNKKTNEYEAPKVSIRRYQKRGGIYKQQSKFNISSAKQGREISSILLNWFPEGADEDKPKKPRAAKGSGSGGAPPPDPSRDDDDDDEVTQQSDI